MCCKLLNLHCTSVQVAGKQGQVLHEVHVEVAGFSERPGSSKFLPGGTDKLPEHFTRQVHLVEEGMAATAALTSQVRSTTAWWPHCRAYCHSRSKC